MCLFSSSLCPTLPILPTVRKSLPSPIPVLHLLSCCPSCSASSASSCILVVTFVTPGRAQNKRSRRLPGLFIRYHVAVRTRCAHKSSYHYPETVNAVQ